MKCSPSPAAGILVCVLAGALAASAEPFQPEVLFNFSEGIDGGYPQSALTPGLDGNLYGTAYSGGSLGYGTVYQLTTNGVFTTIAPFDYTSGANPYSGLIQLPDGSFCGTTLGGGMNGQGTVYQVLTNGTFNVLFSFYSYYQPYPYGGVVLANDGNLYGTTEYGGNYGLGAVYRLWPNGLIDYYSFGDFVGAYPFAGLTLGADGRIYGTTSVGGSAGIGTVFQLATNGDFTSLYSFSGFDGSTPQGQLTLARNGNLYGTTAAGGIAGGNGTLFRMTPDGQLMTLASFGFTNGSSPVGALLEGPDGNFYGATSSGGYNSYGTVFCVTPDGILSTLVFFGLTNGAYASAGLTLGADGNFYGTTAGGGTNGFGTIYRIRVGAPKFFAQPADQIVPAGVTVILYGGVLASQPATYQWMLNGSPVPGATNAELILPQVWTFTSGSYALSVSNSAGVVTSRVASLEVLPVVATMLPVDNITSDSALLNGLVSVGPFVESFAWFDWGTDTGYGNSTSVTEIPGGSGNVQLDATLNGLSMGLIYHCRLVASNELGVVYSGDQAFEVGYAPTVVPLAPTGSGQGITFNALVNPGGPDTSVFVRWGQGTNQVTPPTDIGRGTNFVNFSATIPLIRPGTYQVQVVASNDVGVAFGSSRTMVVGMVDWTNVHQRIDGFGASSAWFSNWTPSQADMFFSTNSGTGTSLNGRTNFQFTGVALSLLRSRIAPDGTSIETGIMKMAQDRGARVWSTPWSPPAAFKTSHSVNGGFFVSSNYQAYANQLAGYVANMKNNYGINLYAVSIQNEPDYNTTQYESCLWSAQQFHDFLPYLSSALVNSNVASTKILMPESANWNFNLAVPSMLDRVTSNYIGILAGHGYGSTPSPVLLSGKPLWETEVATLNTGFNGSISEGLHWASEIHGYLTVAQANAWNFWWLVDGNPSNEGLTDINGVPAKRMYVLGQFSRFVRPNQYRIDVSGTGMLGPVPPYGTSAYQDTNSQSFSIVMFNATPNPLDEVLILTNFPSQSGVVTPWITSASLSLAPQPVLSFNGGVLSYSLPSQSIATLPGESAPVILSQPTSLDINAGDAASFTVTAAGSPPLAYQWNFNNAALDGATNSSLFLGNVQPNQAGIYSVAVTGPGGMVISSNAILRVNLPPVANATATLTPVISANGSNAIVLLNGSRSFDPDGDALQYSWYENQAAAPVATGVVASVSLPVGATPFTLTVSDGMASNSQSIMVNVISVQDAIQRLIATVQSDAPRLRPLEASLSAALASMNRGDIVPTINQLRAFEQKVRAQVAPTNRALAINLVLQAQEIIHTLDRQLSGGG